MKARARRRLVSAGVFVLMTVAHVTHAAVIVNDGFETPGGAGWSYPGAWGGAGSWRDGGPGDAHSGANGATFDALTSLAGDSYFVLSQELVASAAQEWTVSAWLRTVNLGNEDSESWLEVQFLDAGNSILAQSQSMHLTANQDWIQMTLSGLIAPDDTAKISVRGVVYIDPGGTSQTEFHLFDEFVAFFEGEGQGGGGAVPEPTSVGLIGLGALCVYARRRKRMVEQRNGQEGCAS